MNDTKQALEAVVGLVAKATPGPWAKADGGWIEGHNGMEVCDYAGCGSHEADWSPGDLEATLAAVNFLRAHGPALRSALEDAARYRFLATDHSLAWEEELDAAIDQARGKGGGE